MSNKTVVSLFTGAGGLDLGFVKAGFDIVFANETDLFRLHRGDQIRHDKRVIVERQLRLKGQLLERLGKQWR